MGPEHFRKLSLWKSARHCCARMREADAQVKMHKKHHARMTHWFIVSAIQRQIHSVINSLNLRYVDWCIDSLIHYVIGSCSWVYGIMASRNNCFIDSLVHRFIRPVAHQILSCQVVGISTKTCLFVDAPHSFKNLLRLHRKDFPLNHWFLIAISVSGIFRLSMGRALSGDIWCMRALAAKRWF